ncbi:MAG: gliding motility-associated ABC transporter ATP-binding subunit GldA [Bacteroidales bacterium]|jgi:ABC-2 type transport system ATP-binding protein|nr:gliding motility-associated ABC transporter ATP-binding subunit GldA [Bacteroidales bacterium]
MSVEAKQITKLYGLQKALNDVSFSIKAGEVVGFLGPNGAGKSTMMKILTCFIPPSSGEARVCGFDVQEESHEVKKRVGYLPETNPLYLDMYIREYLNFIAGIHKLGTKSRQRIEEMIRITGLETEIGKKLRQLSKGYRQRVGLAGALMHDPEVLILDEPTSGLDPNQLEEIRILIRQIGKEKTVMLSTHIMQEVEAVCNRVIIIDQGILVADSSVAEISTQSSNNAIITVEFDKSFDLTVLGTIPQIIDVKEISKNSYQFISNADTDIRQEIFRFAVENNATVLTMQKEQQRLEKIFQTLTKK